MKLRELYEDGRIVKGVNTTPDVDTNSISKEASKFGFKVDKDGRPPVLKKSERGQSTNVMFNLGMTESRFTPMEIAIMEGGHSIEDLHVTESDLLVQQYSTPSLLKFLKKLSDLPVDVMLRKAVEKELKKRGVKTESLHEIKAVTNIDKGEEIYIPASDFKKAAYETKIKGYEIYRAKSKLGPMPLEHFLVKDPDSDGFLGELKLTGFHKYWSSDVFFDPKIQGKGLALPLYAYVVKKGYDLVSDREQSKGSQAIWKNLTKVPGIFVYAWDRRYDKFFQWDPDEDMDAEIYYDKEKIDQLEKDYKDGKISDEDYKKAQDELDQVMQFSDIRLVAIANKKSKVKENLDEITRRNFLKGIGATAVAGALGGKANIASAALDYASLKPGDKYYYVEVRDTSTGQGGKYIFSLDTFKDIHDAEETIIKHFTDRGHKNIRVNVQRRTKSGSKESIGENFADGKKFVEPNFSSEWNEAARYPEFQKIGKEAWIKLAKKGTAITIKSAKGIENTDAADPDSFKSLDPAKQKRALAQLEKGEVEMPIVAVYSDGYKELIGGNTRLTAMMARDGQATVWAFKVPDEIATLAENFADGKKKGKSRPGRVKKAGASCNGSVTSLRKKAKKYSGERGKMYHWCANMKSGRKKG